MAYGRPHAYHLPSETELAHTQLIIAHRRDRIQFIDKSIEQENVKLDIAVDALDQHYAPTVANLRANLKQLIEREEAKIALLDQEKAVRKAALKEVTRRKINKLEEERAALDKEIGNDKGFIAPIRRLPSELLSEIFLWSGLNGSLWHIIKVCRSWRSVALRTPQLWSSVAITDSTSSLANINGYGCSYTLFSHKRETEEWESAQRCKTVEGLRRALGLTGNTRLRVIINIGDGRRYGYLPGGFADSREESIDMLNLLTEHFPRIQSLLVKCLPYVQHHGEAVNLFRQSVFQGNLSALEELEVAPDTCNPFVNTLMESVQRSARKLRNLTYSYPPPMLVNSERPPDPTLGKQALSGLTSLRLGASSTSFEASIWRSMTNLEELEFSGHVHLEWSALWVPSLKKLTITGGTGTDLGGYFPRLRYLCLINVTLDAPAFSISTPELETLVLHNDRIEVARMIEAPVLDSLEMVGRLMKKSDANQLIATIWNDTAGAGARCLNPRKLRIDVDANDGALVKALKQMDRIEDLQVGIRSKTNLRRKLLADLAVKTKKTPKGSADGLPIVCPNLTRFEVFPGRSTYRERAISNLSDKLQIKALLDGIAVARPTVECVFTEEPLIDTSHLGLMF